MVVLTWVCNNVPRDDKIAFWQCPHQSIRLIFKVAGFVPYDSKPVGTAKLNKGPFGRIFIDPFPTGLK